ncbi:MAG: Rrf2 family transcriptional regulator [Bacteroidetes bacterium]|nr:Rrf2 family transcriptional regulator [Bacteroidota bacterium]
MLFNKKTEYSVKILLYMSSMLKYEYINAGEIAAKINLPKEFLSKILQTLTHYGIVSSQKGKNGGFKLIRDANNIRLIELINAFEDESFFTKCIIGTQKVCAGCNCPMHDSWEKTKTEIKKAKLSEINKYEI